MSLMELQNITFSYTPEDAPVFTDFSWNIEAGQCAILEGDNGSGKTTLFQILNGLVFPQKGAYLFDGTSITQKYLKNNRNQKLFHKRIGYLFQNPEVMLFNATVYDEIAFGPRQMGFSEEEVRQRTEDCLGLFDLKNLSGKAPYHLSGGQKKKVALAAVLSLNPELLILDEPFAGLDADSTDRLMTFLAEWKAAGKTLIIATHNPLVREQLADHTLHLE